MLTTIEHLFVYGTLMSSASDAMGIDARGRLRRESALVAPAVVEGFLFDLGSYPGLVIDHCAPAVVCGEVVKLRDPIHTLIWLDAYESIDPRPGAVNEYRRVSTTVTLDDGSRIEAWLYRYILDAARYPRIPSGRWSDRSAS